MAKPNYSFEKRQRELAKKKKKAEKDARKREAREAASQQAAPDAASPGPVQPPESRDAPPSGSQEPAPAGPRTHLRRTS